MKKNVLLKPLVSLVVSSSIALSSTVVSMGRAQANQPGAPAAATAPLTDEALANAEYLIPGLSPNPDAPDDKVQLKEGKFNDPAQQMNVTLVNSPRTAGDLDGDGTPESLVHLAANFGGSGVFSYLGVVGNVDGKPQSLATVILGDRVTPRSFAVLRNGEIRVMYLDRRITQPMAARPTVTVVRTYRWSGGQLVATSPLSNDALAYATYPLGGAKNGQGTFLAGKYEERDNSLIATLLTRPRATGDLDGDGSPDTVVSIALGLGGSGVLSVIGAVLNKRYGAQPVATLEIGDRLPLTGISVAGGQIEVRYLNRKADEPMSARPTVRASKTFVLKDGKLVELGNQEATNAMTTLQDSSWKLATLGGTPALAETSVWISFGAEGRFSGRDGCNGAGGTYTLAGEKLTLKLGPSTLMACAEPIMQQANAYAKALSATQGYAMKDGQLRLLDADGKELATFGPLPIATLRGTQWSATGVNNGKGGVTSLVIGSEITAMFGEDGKVNGNGGCNSYGGASFKVEGDTIVIGPVISTMKACEPAIMGQELQFFKALERAATLRLSEDKLELRSADGALQVSFQVKQAEAAMPKKPVSYSGVLTGTVMYLARIALPPNAVVEVKLQDTSLADAPAKDIAAQTIKTEGKQVPIPFELKYDPATINDKMRYTLSVRITVEDKLTWINTSSIPVLTRGAPSTGLEVRVDAVK